MAFFFNNFGVVTGWFHDAVPHGFLHFERDRSVGGAVPAALRAYHHGLLRLGAPPHHDRRRPLPRHHLPPPAPGHRHQGVTNNSTK